MNFGGMQTSVNHSPPLTFSQYPCLLFYREKRRRIAETTSNSYHQVDNISCVWYCHFFSSVTTQNGRVPLPSKGWLGSRSLPLPPQKSHSLLSSFPVLKFTLLLALSQEHLNLLLSSLLKNKNKKLPLGPSISLQLPPSLCPDFKTTFSNRCVYLPSPSPHSCSFLPPLLTRFHPHISNEAAHWIQEMTSKIQ